MPTLGGGSYLCAIQPIESFRGQCILQGYVSRSVKNSRHPDMNWPEPNWYDLLNHVVREEPVLVRGAHAFGLKAVTKALNNLGLIDIRWPDGTTDGLGAMAGAWWCDTQAQIEGKHLQDYELMDDIQAYNEIDCQAMFEILSYLRIKH